MDTPSNESELDRLRRENEQLRSGQGRTDPPRNPDAPDHATAGATSTVTGAEPTDDDLSKQTRLAEFANDNKASSADRRCYQRDPNDPSKQCVLAAGHPTEDEDNDDEPLGHVFIANDGTFYNTV